MSKVKPKKKVSHKKVDPEPQRGFLANSPFTQKYKFSKPTFIALAVLLAGVGIYLIIRTFAATGPVTTSYAPDADAFVNKAAPSTNYGNAPSLQTVAGSTTTTRHDGLLKFNVANLPIGKITGATLWLFVTNGSKNGGTVYSADANWSESAVTWSTRPALLGTTTTGPAFSETTSTTTTVTSTIYPSAKVGSVTTGHWKSVDVTPTITGNGIVSFRIINGSANNAVYSSKEGTHPPRLEVSVDTTIDSVPPAAPNVSGWATSAHTTDLTWTPSSDNVGVAYYDIYVNGTLYIHGQKLANPSQVRSYSFQLLNPDTSYSYYVVGYDAAGNASAPSNTVNVKTSPVDTTDRQYTTPEGTNIEINTAGGFTYDQIYKMLKDNAYPGDFAAIAPRLNIVVGDTLPSQTSPASGSSNGIPTFGATVNLQGTNSTFAAVPDSVMSHEYGHVWTLYHKAIDHNEDWSGYLNTRWDNADGSLVIGQDSRLNSSYSWTTREIAADDYRLLFGTDLAKAEQNIHLNPYISDPRNQPDLKDWFLNYWAVKQP